MASSTASFELAPPATANAPAASASALAKWHAPVLRLCAFIALLLAADRLVATVLRHGLDRYFGLDRDAVVLCVGHSRTVLGIDDALLQRELNVPVAKYAVNGANTQDRLAMVRQYLNHHRSVKVLVYDVSAFTFTDKGLSSNSYKLFYPYLDDPDMSADIHRNAVSSSEIWCREIFHTLRFDETTLALAFRGYSGLHGNFKIGSVNVAATRASIAAGQTRSMAIDPDNVALFEQTLDFAHAHGVRVVLVYIPTLDILSNSNRPAHDAAIALVRQIAAAHPGVTFLDYNSDLETHHELFFDPIHMNAAGQAVVSGRLAEDLSLELARDPTVPEPLSANH